MSVSAFLSLSFSLSLTQRLSFVISSTVSLFLYALSSRLSVFACLVFVSLFLVLGLCVFVFVCLVLSCLRLST